MNLLVRQLSRGIPFTILCCFISKAGAVVTDTSAELIVPAGDTYTLSGNHSYLDYIQIDGTLYVEGYSPGVSDGTLDLIASSIPWRNIFFWYPG